MGKLVRGTDRAWIKPLFIAVTVSFAVAGIVKIIIATSHDPAKGDNWSSVLGGIFAFLLHVGSWLVEHFSRSAPGSRPDESLLNNIREDIYKLRRVEAQERGLLQGMLLPITIGDRSRFTTSTPQPEIPSERLNEDANMPTGFRSWWTRRRASREAHTPPLHRPGADDQLWKPIQFQAAWADFVSSFPENAPVHGAIYGPGGSGKSTLALMLTLGLASPHPAVKNEVDLRLLPLMVSVTGYDGRVEFSTWINRKVMKLYPGATRIKQARDDIRGVVGVLLNQRRALLILDGVDEIPTSAKASALRQIGEFLLDDDAVILLSRAEDERQARALLGVLRDSHPLWRIHQPQISERQAYLRHRASRIDRGLAQQRVASLAPAIADSEALRVVLSTPQMLELAGRAAEANAVSLSELEDLASNPVADATLGRLVKSLVNRAIDPDRVRPADSRVRVARHPQAGRWLTYLAHEMIEREVTQLAWWQTNGPVPTMVPALAAAFAATPAYLLALRMPVGLTRGLAIGCIVGLGAAFLRAKPVRYLEALIVMAAITAPVAALGTVLRSWQQGVADALEIGGSSAAAFLMLDGLLRSRWPIRWGAPPKRLQQRYRNQRDANRERPIRRFVITTVPAVVVVIVAAALGTMPTLLFRYLTKFHDPERSPALVYVGVAFGIGLATVASRAYITTEVATPSAYKPGQFWPTPAKLRGSLTGLVFAISIGAGGAIGGGLRYHAHYGFSVAVAFFFIAGLPVGLVGVAVKWLWIPLEDGSGKSPSPPIRSTIAQPSVGRARTVPLEDGQILTDRPLLEMGSVTTTMRQDRYLALSILSAVAVLSAASIWFFTHQEARVVAVIKQSAPFYAIQPWDALLVTSTLGLIVACTYTVWPVFAVAHLWLAGRRRRPWRLRRFAAELQYLRIIIRDGEVYKFRYDGLRTYLGEDLYKELWQLPRPTDYRTPAA